MKQAIKRGLQAILIVPLLALGVSAVAPMVAPEAHAAEYTIQGGADAAKGDNTPENLFSGDNAIFKTIVNIMLFIIGAISVIMLIIGGIRYVVSGGDQNAVSGAKNTILYAIIGIIVALLAYAIVNFVVGGISDNF